MTANLKTEYLLQDGKKTPNAEVLIADIVQQYKKVLKTEYDIFLLEQNKRRELLNDEYAQLSGSDFIERQLCSYPENLYYFIKAKLTEDDFKWFTSLEGNKWMMENYPEFKITKDY